MTNIIQFVEENFDLLPLQEEASTRRYFKARVKEKYLDKYESLRNKELVICKDSNINQDFIELTEFLSKQNVLVPEVFGIDDTQSIIFQEDLGNIDIYSKSIEEYIDLVYKSIDILIHLQSLKAPALVSNRFFDFEKLNFEIQLTLSSLRKLETSIEIEFYISSEFVIFLEETCKHLEKQEPMVFTHRDFHSRNIMTQNGNLYLIDYQDARMGHPTYDLSSILYDAYKPLPLTERKKMLEYFRVKSKISNKGFYDTFYLQALQRSFKALGTYIIQINEKNNLKFLPSFYSCLDNLEEISQLGQLPDSVYIFIVDLRKKIQSVPKFGLNV